MQLLESLKWRYAVKKYDTSKKVSQQNVGFIKEAVQLAASSYGLQPYKVLDIKSPTLREKLKPLSWNQAQITEASHLFVFCNAIAVTDEDVEDSIKFRAKIREIEIDKLVGYGDFVKGKLHKKSTEELFHWSAKQAYIGLANAMNACAELKIDCSPLEGFEASEVNELLGLQERGLNACVMLAVGYRHADDATQNLKKFRKSIDTMFEEI
ncbi:NAD(P)H-dependent oxidoreductase [Brumimicrobium glaciale]|uniref:NAD(P)H-dependent oxidoreductase n=1 Tax=Brumimicrobium glaciale TaxID=200475 RepID=A0A4Q4KJE3_9FLAO|nr:NAD(P)H-dependent oxidoreductase [Brumimicrobium glaciale]RYM33305.1 NAD(P)H-dependent oxidoreductase [Brumimicrobium glaciale]